MVTVSGNPNPTNPTYPTNPTNPTNPTTKYHCEFVNLNCIYTKLGMPVVIWEHDGIHVECLPVWIVFCISAAYMYFVADVGRHKLSYWARTECDVTNTPYLERQSIKHPSLPTILRLFQVLLLSVLIYVAGKPVKLVEAFYMIRLWQILYIWWYQQLPSANADIPPVFLLSPRTDT